MVISQTGSLSFIEYFQKKRRSASLTDVNEKLQELRAQVVARHGVPREERREGVLSAAPPTSAVLLRERDKYSTAKEGCRVIKQDWGCILNVRFRGVWMLIGCEQHRGLSNIMFGLTEQRPVSIVKTNCPVTVKNTGDVSNIYFWF